MDFSHLTTQQCFIAVLAALTIGLAKSGFGGVGMLTIALMAAIMPGHERESTGVVLPLLICGDLFAIRAFRSHVQWAVLVRMLPPALMGVLVGYFSMRDLTNTSFKPVIGWIVLVLVGLQLWRQLKPDAYRGVPHTRWFAWTIGIGAGITTMLANAAGPIMTLYFLAVRLPKLEFVATAAWFFLIVNLSKIPFSAKLGFIHAGSLLFNLVLVPFVGIGIALGRSLLHRINQQIFERVLLGLTGITALHLIFF